jgi:hypothetical protein
LLFDEDGARFVQRFQWNLYSGLDFPIIWVRPDQPTGPRLHGIDGETTKLIDQFEERGRAAAAMPAEAGPSSSEAIADPQSINDEDRRDSAADKALTPSADELQDRGPVNVRDDPALQDLERTSQPPYSRCRLR